MTDRSAPMLTLTVLDQAGNQELLSPEEVKVLNMTYTDSEKAADKLELTVDNFDLANFDNPIWRKGNRVRVSWGYPGNMAPSRECVIRKVTGFTQLKIEARGMAVVMNRVTRSRTWENMSIPEIARQIARENGYGDDSTDIQDSVTVQASTPPTDTEIAQARTAQFRASVARTRINILAADDAIPDAVLEENLRNIERLERRARRVLRSNRVANAAERRPHVVQANMTDAQFLRRLAHQTGFVWFIDFDGFHFHEPRIGQDAARSVTYYNDQEVGEVLGINIKNDVTAQPGRVNARRRDPTAREDSETSSDNDTDGNRPSAGTILEVIDPETGDASLRKLVSQQRTTRGQGGAQGSTQEEARAQFRRAQRRAVKMTLNMVGDPQILAKSVITVLGIGQRLSGNYYIREARHNVSSSGYTLDLELIKDATGAYARRAGRRGDGLPEVGSEPRASGAQGAEEEEGNERSRRPPTRAEIFEQINQETGEATRTIRHVPRRGRDSRAGGGRPASPASTTAAAAGRNTR